MVFTKIQRLNTHLKDIDPQVLAKNIQNMMKNLAKKPKPNHKVVNGLNWTAFGNSIMNLFNAVPAPSFMFVEVFHFECSIYQYNETLFFSS
jgi:hypothetical protein